MSNGLTIVFVLAVIFVPFMYFMAETIADKRIEYLKDCTVTTYMVETKAGWTPVYDCKGKK